MNKKVIDIIRKDNGDWYSNLSDKGIYNLYKDSYIYAVLNLNIALRDLIDTIKKEIKKIFNYP